MDAKKKCWCGRDRRVLHHYTRFVYVSSPGNSTSVWRTKLARSGMIPAVLGRAAPRIGVAAGTSGIRETKMRPLQPDPQFRVYKPAMFSNAAILHRAGLGRNAAVRVQLLSAPCRDTMLSDDARTNHTYAAHTRRCWSIVGCCSSRAACMGAAPLRLLQCRIRTLHNAVLQPPCSYRHVRRNRAVRGRTEKARGGPKYKYIRFRQFQERMLTVCYRIRGAKPCAETSDSRV